MANRNANLGKVALAMLAVLAFQNRDKIGDLLRGPGPTRDPSDPQRGTGPGRDPSDPQQGGLLEQLSKAASGTALGDVLDATRSMLCLHATDPATVFLSAWARVDGFTLVDLERALYADRSLVKQLAMRRTLFVFPRETLSVAQAGASNRVAANERKRLVRDVVKAHVRHAGVARVLVRPLKRLARRVVAVQIGARERARHLDQREAAAAADVRRAAARSELRHDAVEHGQRDRHQHLPVPVAKQQLRRRGAPRGRDRPT